MALFWKGEGGTPAKVLHPKQVGGAVLLASLLVLGASYNFGFGIGAVFTPILFFIIELPLQVPVNPSA